MRVEWFEMGCLGANLLLIKIIFRIRVYAIALKSK